MYEGMKERIGKKSGKAAGETTGRNKASKSKRIGVYSFDRGLFVWHKEGVLEAVSMT